MTRATLLQVLARPTALGPAEVRELEQLAQAFPYCQTAHLLLAKAAHDQGTMLAGQRLRRAATYAADRALLRRLIEEVEPAPIQHPEPVSAGEAAPLAPVAQLPAAEPLIASPATEATTQAPQLAAAPHQAVEAAAPSATAPVAPVPLVAPVASEVAAAPELAIGAVAAAPVTVVAALVLAPEPAPPAEVPQVPAQITIEEPTADLAPAATPVVDTEAEPAPPETPPVAEYTAPDTAPAPAIPVPVAEALPEPEPAPLEEAPAAEEAPAEAPAIEVVAAILPELVDQEGAQIATAAPVAELLPEVAPEEEPDLPAQAPAIRPPVEAGEARFEFGLAEPPPPPPAYELPGLVDEWAAAAVTLSLGSPEPAASSLPPGGRPAAPPVLTPAAFTGDATIGYGFGESSRLGFSMQLLELLTDKAEKDAAATKPAEMPAAPLPPVGAFFEPDPLLLDHWATHCPPAPVLPSSLDLINNFLKRQPRLTRPGMLPPAPGGQTDLSLRSTRAEPDLVSENLARIFVRQGKIARAIEIYEKLMVKQPEKTAHFMAQIESLKTQPPIS